jgi:hypothetical protein
MKIEIGKRYWRRDGKVSGVIVTAKDDRYWCFSDGDMGPQAWSRMAIVKATHRITFDLIDGKPDLDSIKMEELP